MSATVAERLATRARAPIGSNEADALRALTLTNVAAAIGDRGAIGRTVDAFPFDTGLAHDAAYLLATRLHARTQDDFYPEGRVHVGAISLAAVLALAPFSDASLLEPLAAGYRVVCDVSTAYAQHAQERGLRPSGVFGPMGAAAAAAVALGLDEAATADAIGVAAAACGGHNQAWISGSDEWILEVGSAARAGVEAALFVRGGVRAAAAAFDGPAGWAAAFFGRPGAAELIAQLAGPLADATLVAVKPYPVSGIAQVPTHLGARAHAWLDGRPAAQLCLRMSPAEFAYPGSSGTGPFESRSDALMSVAFCVACAALEGVVPLARLENPQTSDLASALAAVEVTPDPALPENHSVLSVAAADGTSAQFTASAADLLHPDWAALTDDIDALAQRSEASAVDIATVASVLGAAQPSTAVLRELMLRAVEREEIRR